MCVCVCVCVCPCRYLHACVGVVYRADLYTIFWLKGDIVGQVLGPIDSVCVCLCGCLHACVCVVYRADLYTIF